MQLCEALAGTLVGGGPGRGCRTQAPDEESGTGAIDPANGRPKRRWSDGTMPRFRGVEVINPPRMTTAIAVGLADHS